MTIITRAQLAILAPKAKAQIVAGIVDHADDVLPRYGLATRARLTDFMAHVLVESAYLTALEEDLNYSATRLMEVWRERFPTLGSCTGFAHSPEPLACKVYGGRMGNVGPRDGWLYRGKGLLQITGKSRYAQLAKALGKSLDETAQFITSDAGMLECAAAVYVMLGAPVHADRGDIVGSTRCINGGTNGLADRKVMLAKCQKVWPGEITASAPAITLKPAPSATPVLDSIVSAIARNAAAAVPTVNTPAVRAAVPPAPLVTARPTAPAEVLPAAKPGLLVALWAYATSRSKL